jgi:ketosteroid isomerase-like protein
MQMGNFVKFCQVMQLMRCYAFNEGSLKTTKGDIQMNTKLNHIIKIALIFALSLAGCTSPAAPASSTAEPNATASSTAIPGAAVNPTDKPNAAAVLAMVERMNAGDLEGSLKYFADDAIIYFIGMPPRGMEIYRGKEQIRSVWKDCIENHFKWEAEIDYADGDIVQANTKTWHDFTRQIGVAPNEYFDVYLFKDGKISSYASTITEQALARFKPALAKVMPPDPTPVPSVEDPVSALTITVLDGTCTYEGPMTLKAGEITVTWDVKDQNKDKFGLTFHNLDAGKDLTDLMAATVGFAPSWAHMLAEWEQGPGMSQSYHFTVKQGPVYLICWSKPPDIPIGNVGPFEVKQ